MKLVSTFSALRFGCIVRTYSLGAARRRTSRAITGSGYFHQTLDTQSFKRSPHLIPRNETIRSSSVTTKRDSFSVCSLLCVCVCFVAVEYDDHQMRPTTRSSHRDGRTDEQQQQRRRRRMFGIPLVVLVGYAILVTMLLMIQLIHRPLEGSSTSSSTSSSSTMSLGEVPESFSTTSSFSLHHLSFLANFFRELSSCPILFSRK